MTTTSAPAAETSKPGILRQPPSNRSTAASSRTIQWLVSIFLIWAAVPTALAQQPPGGMESRLEAMESLYQQRASENRAPLIKRYIEDLEKLRDSYRRDSRTRSASAVEEEIKRATEAMNLGTELPLPSDPEESSGGANLFETIRRFGTLSGEANAIVLPASSAEASSSTWQELQASPALLGDENASLGSRSWKAEELPAGRYEVVVAMVPDLGMFSNWITLEVNESVDVRSRVRELPDLIGDRNLSYLHLGTINISEGLEGATIKVSARPRRSQEDDARPVTLRAAMLIAR